MSYLSTVSMNFFRMLTAIKEAFEELGTSCASFSFLRVEFAELYLVLCVGTSSDGYTRRGSITSPNWECNTVLPCLVFERSIAMLLSAVFEPSTKPLSPLISSQKVPPNHGAVGQLPFYQHN